MYILQVSDLYCLRYSCRYIIFSSDLSVYAELLPSKPRASYRQQEQCNVLRKSFFQKNPVVASLWPIGTGLSPLGWEKFWLRRIRKRASPAENSEKKLRTPSPARTTISRGLTPCTLHKKHTQNAKINLSRPSRKGPRMRATLLSLRLKKSQIYLTLVGGRVG